MNAPLKRFQVVSRENHCLSGARIQSQMLAAPAGFEQAVVDDIVAARSQLLPLGRATLADAPYAWLADMYELFEYSLREYLAEHYSEALVAENRLFVDLFPMVRLHGKALATHGHAEAFLSMVYYPLGADCEEVSPITLTDRRFMENQLVLCPPASPRLEERFAKSPQMMLQVSPKPGMMLIAPGNLPHFVAPGQPGRRVSVIGLVFVLPKNARPLLSADS